MKNATELGASGRRYVRVKIPPVASAVFPSATYTTTPVFGYAFSAENETSLYYNYSHQCHQSSNSDFSGIYRTWNKPVYMRFIDNEKVIGRVSARVAARVVVEKRYTSAISAT